MRIFSIIGSIFNKNLILINNNNCLDFFIKNRIYNYLNKFFKFSIFFKKNIFLFFIFIYETIVNNNNRIIYTKLTNNFFSINDKVVKFTVNTKNEKLSSIEMIFGNAKWLEREVREFFNINYLNKADNRSLFLWSGFLGNPLKKNYPTIGFFELSVKYKLGLHFKKIIHV